MDFNFAICVTRFETVVSLKAVKLHDLPVWSYKRSNREELSVSVTTDYAHANTRLAAFLQLTKHEFGICGLLRSSSVYLHMYVS